LDFELCTAQTVDSGTITDCGWGEGDGVGVFCDEGVKVRFHEPGKGFQVDYLQGGRRGVLKEDLETAAFLAVTR
jgi:hypothetical protein